MFEVVDTRTDTTIMVCNHDRVEDVPVPEHCIPLDSVHAKRGES